MKRTGIIQIISVLFALTMLAGCHDSNSGGTSDSGDNGSTPTGSSNWDQMTWDQDNWG